MIVYRRRQRAQYIIAVRCSRHHPSASLPPSSERRAKRKPTCDDVVGGKVSQIRNSELKFIPELLIRNCGENFSLKNFYLLKLLRYTLEVFVKITSVVIPTTARRVVAPYGTMSELCREAKGSLPEGEETFGFFKEFFEFFELSRSD